MYRQLLRRPAATVALFLGLVASVVAEPTSNLLAYPERLPTRPQLKGAQEPRSLIRQQNRNLQRSTGGGGGNGGGTNNGNGGGKATTTTTTATPIPTTITSTITTTTTLPVVATSTTTAAPATTTTTRAATTATTAAATSTTAGAATTTAAATTTTAASTTTTTAAATTTTVASSIGTYSCKVPGKTPCTATTQCYDASGISGANPDCGTVYCDATTGACVFDAWKNTAACEYTYGLCAGIDAICYAGPTALSFLGTCTGFQNNQCVYAWCPGDAAPPQTTPPPPTTTTTTASPPLGLTSLALQPSRSAALKVGDNMRIVARGAGGDGVLRDVTSRAAWTSSNPNVVGVAIPGLAEAKSTGTAILTASLEGKTASITVTVGAAGAAAVCDERLLKLKALVVKQSDSDIALPTIRRALGYVGVPYVEAAAASVTTISFVDAAAPCRGNYQAVYLTDGTLRLGTGLVDATGLNLNDYGSNFRVRIVNWLAYPTSDFGFGTLPTNTGDDRMFSVTAQGQQVFSYLSTAQIAVANANMYLSKPLSAAAPLLLDSTGNAGAVVYESNGLEQLTLTMVMEQTQRHSILLGYGIVNWSTRGRFLGNRRIYVSAHIDDFIIDDHIWVPGTPCGTPPWESQVKYRMNSTDLSVVLNHQDRLHTNPMFADFVMDMVYNGVGSGSRFAPDTLTPLAKQRQAEFKWINHGFEHLFLDLVSYAVAYKEVKSNQIIAGKDQLGLTRYSDSNQVTGQVSGLKNPDYLRAAYDRGIRFLVTDTSRQGENPGDNLGLYNWFVPGIFMIPRRANNLFYNVALRDQWEAEYNCLYGSYWGRDLSTAEIVEFESEQLVTYMIRGESYPWMFHQPNLRAYIIQGRNITLIEELLDATFAKYAALYNLPVLSPTMDDLGRIVISHMEIKNVTAILAPGMGVLMDITSDATVPLTGFHVPGGTRNLMYGGQKQTYVDLKAGKSLFLPLN